MCLPALRAAGLKDSVRFIIPGSSSIPPHQALSWGLGWWASFWGAKGAAVRRGRPVEAPQFFLINSEGGDVLFLLHNPQKGSFWILHKEPIVYAQSLVQKRSFETPGRQPPRPSPRQIPGGLRSLLTLGLSRINWGFLDFSSRSQSWDGRKGG